ncbi:uncharacterized protein LOC119590592 [Penaeus monodon]|uniref:uncharacterized protein LOC119590592 n=1 Tax=Penaeus monodon TaxID=6687 RepID=UPI0018A75F30|nr:uncharacterized protein LOC119590592 [Penaeus monodon]
MTFAPDLTLRMTFAPDLTLRMTFAPDLTLRVTYKSEHILRMTLILCPMRTPSPLTPPRTTWPTYTQNTGSSRPPTPPRNSNIPSYSFTPEVLLHSNHLPASFPLDLGPRDGRQFEDEVFPMHSEGRGGGYNKLRPNRVFSRNVHTRPVHKRVDWYFLGPRRTVPRPTPFLHFVYDLQQSPSEFGYPKTRFGDADEMWYQPDGFHHNTLRKQMLGW